MRDLPGRSAQSTTDRNGRRRPQLQAAAAAGGPKTGPNADVPTHAYAHARGLPGASPSVTGQGWVGGARWPR